MDTNLVYLFIGSPILGLLAYAFYGARKDIVDILEEAFQSKHTVGLGILLSVVGISYSVAYYITRGFQINPSCPYCSSPSFDSLPAVVIFTMSAWVLLILCLYDYEAHKNDEYPPAQVTK